MLEEKPQPDVPSMKLSAPVQLTPKSKTADVYFQGQKVGEAKNVRLELENNINYNLPPPSEPELLTVEDDHNVRILRPEDVRLISVSLVAVPPNPHCRIRDQEETWGND